MSATHTAVIAEERVGVQFDGQTIHVDWRQLYELQEALRQAEQAASKAAFRCRSSRFDAAGAGLVVPPEDEATGRRGGGGLYAHTPTGNGPLPWGPPVLAFTPYRPQYRHMRRADATWTLTFALNRQVVLGKADWDDVDALQGFAETMLSRHPDDLVMEAALLGADQAAASTRRWREAVDFLDRAADLPALDFSGLAEAACERNLEISPLHFMDPLTCRVVELPGLATVRPATGRVHTAAAIDGALRGSGLIPLPSKRPLTSWRVNLRRVAGSRGVKAALGGGSLDRAVVDAVLAAAAPDAADGILVPTPISLAEREALLAR